MTSDPGVRYVRHLPGGAACAVGADGAIRYLCLPSGETLLPGPGEIIADAKPTLRGDVAVLLTTPVSEDGGRRSLAWRVYSPEGRLASVLQTVEGRELGMYTDYRRGKVYRFLRLGAGRLRVVDSWELAGHRSRSLEGGVL